MVFASRSTVASLSINSGIRSHPPLLSRAGRILGVWILIWILRHCLSNLEKGTKLLTYLFDVERELAS